MPHDLLARAIAHEHRFIERHHLPHARAFNSKLATTITNAVGTMWCAYAFMGLALIALPSALQQGIFTTVVWISQSFLQLVLLSVIMVGQNLSAAHSDARAQADHETLHLLAQVNARQLEILELLHERIQAE